MAKRGNRKGRDIETYAHIDKGRVNNPPVGLVRAGIDPELIEAYRGAVSLPFEAGERGRVAVKIVDDRGVESLKIVELV